VALPAARRCAAWPGLIISPRRAGRPAPKFVCDARNVEGHEMSWELAGFFLVGFLAQLVDGALGMAYGLISSSVLLNLGVPPALASASIHIAEIGTTGASGLSHAMFRNIDRELFLRLVVPGVIGGVAGAYLLSSMPGDFIRPVVAAYLMLMGARILLKAWRVPEAAATRPGSLPALGLVGGFLDAIGGGGWGPIVASTLLARGAAPRYAIGSVNLAEFFLTVATSAGFVLSLGLEQLPWRIIAALVLGGLLAAPLGAFLVKHVRVPLLMGLVGLLVVALSATMLVRSLL
jgi:uncharacterized membrane protein YfcA